MALALSARAPKANHQYQRKRSLSSAAGFVAVVCGVPWPGCSCYGAGAVARAAGPAVRGGLVAGMGNIRAEAMVSRGAVRVPVTRVLSLCVVQAGSARPRMRAGMPRQRSTELVRSSGRPGESCPSFPAGLIPDDLAGSLSPC